MSDPRPTASASVYLESRYRKLVRGLPQTVLFCPRCKGGRRRRVGCPLCEGRGRLADDSVQQIIGRSLSPLFGARLGRFHGAGREDIDVLMLGRGRPFVFEVVGAAHPDIEVADLHSAVGAAAGGRIEVAPFVRCTRERVRFWKTANFAKTYRARASLEAPPTVDPATLVGGDFVLAQRTPERVAHRRADLVRERRVEIQAVTVVGACELDLTLRCEHGTYVKEWVSGDGGRTVPSVARLLGSPATCTELDVLDIGDLEKAESVRSVPPR